MHELWVVFLELIHHIAVPRYLGAREPAMARYAVEPHEILHTTATFAAVKDLAAHLARRHERRAGQLARPTSWLAHSPRGFRVVSRAIERSNDHI